MQEEGHVAAELHRDGVKPIMRDGFSRQHGQREKDRCGVGRSATQSRSGRDVFPEMERYIALNTQGFENQVRRSLDEVVGDLRGSFNGDPGGSRRAERDLEPISQGNGLKDGSDLVVSVLPPVENSEPQVQLGVSGYPHCHLYRWW